MFWDSLRFSKYDMKYKVRSNGTMIRTDSGQYFEVRKYKMGEVYFLKKVVS